MNHEGSAAEPRLISVYADESCLGNGREGSNPGGAGAVIEYMSRAGALVRRDLWISEPATTNNRMALRSVIDSFTLLSARQNTFDVVFTSDSQYLILGMTEWVHGWAARGWRRKAGPIENLELWFDAIRSVKGHRVQWRWVRGHDGHPQNAYADHLATAAAAAGSSSGGLVESRFAEWLTLEQESRRIKVSAEAFPDPATFRAHRALPAPAPASGSGSGSGSSSSSGSGGGSSSSSGSGGGSSSSGGGGATAHHS